MLKTVKGKQECNVWVRNRKPKELMGIIHEQKLYMLINKECRKCETIENDGLKKTIHK